MAPRIHIEKNYGPIILKRKRPYGVDDSSDSDTADEAPWRCPPCENAWRAKGNDKGKGKGRGKAAQPFPQPGTHREPGVPFTPAFAPFTIAFPPSGTPASPPPGTPASPPPGTPASPPPGAALPPPPGTPVSPRAPASSSTCGPPRAGFVPVCPVGPPPGDA